MSMKKLINVSKEEQDTFLESFDVVLSDVDGVLFGNVDSAIEGAANAVKNLRLLGKKVYFVTNNSFASIEWQLKRFKDFDINKDEIIRPALAVIWYLKQLNFDKEVYVVGFEALRSELEEAGIKVIYDEVKPLQETVEGWASITKDLRPNVGVVLMDFSLNVTYTQLQRCIEYIKVNKALFLLGAPNRDAEVFNTTFLANMPFANIVKDFTGVTPEVLAKPGKALKNVLKESLGLSDPKRVIFIGDTVDIDLEFAAECGYQKILTLTGCTKAEELTDWKYEENYKPDYVLDTIKDLEIITSRKLHELK